MHSLVIANVYTQLLMFSQAIATVQKNTSLRQVPPNHTGVCVACEMYTEEEVNRNNGGCIEYLAPSTIGSRLWVGGKCLPLPTSGSLMYIHIHGTCVHA